MDTGKTVEVEDVPVSEPWVIPAPSQTPAPVEPAPTPQREPAEPVPA